MKSRLPTILTSFYGGIYSDFWGLDNFCWYAILAAVLRVQKFYYIWRPQRHILKGERYGLRGGFRAHFRGSDLHDLEVAAPEDRRLRPHEPHPRLLEQVQGDALRQQGRGRGDRTGTLLQGPVRTVPVAVERERPARVGDGDEGEEVRRHHAPRGWNAELAEGQAEAERDDADQFPQHRLRRAEAGSDGPEDGPRGIGERAQRAGRPAHAGRRRRNQVGQPPPYLCPVRERNTRHGVFYFRGLFDV